MDSRDHQAYWTKREQELTAKVPANKIYKLQVKLAAMEADQGAVSEEQIEAVRAQLATLTGDKLDKSDVLAKWTVAMGKSESDLQKLGDRWIYSRWEHLPASKFSSPEMHETFRGFMADWDKTA